MKKSRPPAATSSAAQTLDVYFQFLAQRERFVSKTNSQMPSETMTTLL
jgi:hypothetical protein